jgi:hypothetical protein
MKLKTLSRAQRVAWYIASLVYGIGVVVMLGKIGEFADLSPNLFHVIVAGASWLGGVICLRLYIQDVKIP